MRPGVGCGRTIGPCRPWDPSCQGVPDVQCAVGVRVEAHGHVLRGGIEDDRAVLVPAPGRETGPVRETGPGRRQGRARGSPSRPARASGPHTTYAADRGAQAERGVALGARRMQWDRCPEAPDFVRPEDPDCNRFCVRNAGRDTEGAGNAIGR